MSEKLKRLTDKEFSKGQIGFYAQEFDGNEIASRVYLDFFNNVGFRPSDFEDAGRPIYRKVAKRVAKYFEKPTINTFEDIPKAALGIRGSKYVNMTSDKLKTLFIAYLRYKRQISLVATEVLYADILYLNNKNMCYEIEVKVSKSDFLADFKKSNPMKIKPNFKYYGTTPEIRDYVVKYLDDNNLPYGVISCDNSGNVGIYKTAKKLIDEEKGSFTRNEIIKRMASELYSLREKLYFNTALKDNLGG